MKMEELAERWIEETERVAGLVKHDFMLLNEKQLTYKVHVDHCNIHQIIQLVLSNNSSMLARIERAIPHANSTGSQENYRPGFIGRYILNRMASAGCNTKKIKNQGADLRELSRGILFLKIIGQQNSIKEMVTFSKSVDMNSRVVSFGLQGLIRLSIAETFEYLVLYQKRHLIMARHLLMLQQV